MTSAGADARLARLFVAVVLGRWDDLRAARRAAAPGEPDRRWREAVLQAHLFAGFPRVVEALGVLHEEGGLGAPDPDELADASGTDDRAAGRALFETIYAEDAGRVRDVLARGHPALADWIEAHAYDRVLARPGLDAATRELLACAGLAATGQDRQLASHARGALRCGATPARLWDALDAVADRLDPADRDRAERVVARFAGPRPPAGG